MKIFGFTISKLAIALFVLRVVIGFVAGYTKGSQASPAHLNNFRADRVVRSPRIRI